MEIITAQTISDMATTFGKLRTTGLGQDEYVLIGLSRRFYLLPIS